jgi:pyruvate/2-oxoglutarate dehydrogenase complex dihydrolipoamide dehydrogenase (E3) component
MIPYTNLFQIKTNKVVQASAVKLEKNQIHLDQSVPEFGNTINYDYLIISTGTHYPAPAKATTLDYESSRANLQSLRAQIKSAKSIVIVGGGPVGIELAGEIRDVYVDTKITIIHNKDGFMDEASLPTPKLRQKLNDLATKNKIETLFNCNVILPTGLTESFYVPEGRLVETSSGNSITGVDLVLLAFGNRPQTEWLKNSSLGTEIVNANGYVKVKKTLQIDHAELNHVFVLGDAADLNETKMAFRIGAHVSVVVENITQVAIKKGKPTAEYKKGPDAMFVTFGKKQGAGVLPLFGGVMAGNWIVSTLKGTSLFTSQSFKALNAKEPANIK